MLTFQQKWQSLHHPSTDVSGDADFYCRLYEKLCRLTRQEARQSDAAILSLLLYTENIIATGLDGVYEYMYRSLGDVVFRWCDGLGMDANATSQVHNLVSEAVAEAPRSTLRRWITESVRSRDFLRLSDMLVYFAREDRILRRVYPNLRYREAMFLRLTGNRQAARYLSGTDLAFNWHDKQGNTLPATLAGQFRLLAVPAEGEEKSVLLETAGYLESICSERLDTYRVTGRKDRHTLTLRHRNGRLFKDVTFPSPLPETDESQHLTAQLVTYLGKTRASGPVRWLGKESVDAWNGETLWDAIDKEERKDAKRTYFTTFFGKRLSLYDDLYTLPQDPEEARYASQGIYLDEPNILDFLQWLKPEETAPL